MQWDIKLVFLILVIFMILSVIIVVIVVWPRNPCCTAGQAKVEKETLPETVTSNEIKLQQYAITPKDQLVLARSSPFSLGVSAQAQIASKSMFKIYNHLSGQLLWTSAQFQIYPPYSNVFLESDIQNAPDVVRIEMTTPDGAVQSSFTSVVQSTAVPVQQALVLIHPATGSLVVTKAESIPNFILSFPTSALGKTCNIVVTNENNVLIGSAETLVSALIMSTPITSTEAVNDSTFMDLHITASVADILETKSIAYLQTSVSGV